MEHSIVTHDVLLEWCVVIHRMRNGWLIISFKEEIIVLQLKTSLTF